MPYLTEDYYQDEHGVYHPRGIRERVELITNPLAVVNRTIPMAMIEASVTFIMDRSRKHAARMEDPEKAIAFLFDILCRLNPFQGKDFKDLFYKELSKREQKEFITDAISVDQNGLLMTDNGMYLRWEAFNDEFLLRDAIAGIYTDYPDIFKPYHIFNPKPKWGRDIYIGDDYVGYQYIMMLKQSGEKGFSVRSSGAISEEGLPEKSGLGKISRHFCSEKPIRFGENCRYHVNCGNGFRSEATAMTQQCVIVLFVTKEGVTTPSV